MTSAAQPQTFVYNSATMQTNLENHTHPQPGNSGADLTACQLNNSSCSLPEEAARSSTRRSKKAADSSKKRELRLMKNRDAARKFRSKRKKYWQDLEAHNAFLEYENELLKAEVQYWKQLCMNAPQNQCSVNQ